MASAKEIDLDPNAYVGLSFPLRRSATSDFEQTKNTLAAAKHNIKNLLLTHIGERDFLGSLWSKIREKFRKYTKSGKLR